MKKVSNFDVLREMGDRNLDIRAFPVYDNLIQASQGKGRGTILLSVDPRTAGELMAGKHLIATLIIADGKQFSDLKEEMENEE
jgi:hypothetical protein